LCLPGFLMGLNLFFSDSALGFWLQVENSDKLFGVEAVFAVDAAAETVNTHQAQSESVPFEGFAGAVVNQVDIAFFKKAIAPGARDFAAIVPDFDAITLFDKNFLFHEIGATIGKLLQSFGGLKRGDSEPGKALLISYENVCELSVV